MTTLQGKVALVADATRGAGVLHRAQQPRGFGGIALRGQIERGDTAPHPGTWHEWLDDVTMAADEDS